MLLGKREAKVTDTAVSTGSAALGPCFRSTVPSTKTLGWLVEVYARRFLPGFRVGTRAPPAGAKRSTIWQ